MVINVTTYIIYNDELDIYHEGKVYLNSFNDIYTAINLRYTTMKDANKALKEAQLQPLPGKINVDKTAFTQWHIGEIYSVFHPVK